MCRGKEALKSEQDSLPRWRSPGFVQLGDAAADKKPAAAKKPAAGFAKPVQPDDALSAVVGSTPLPRTELTKKLWEYIRAHKLQDPAKKTLINADDKLKAVFDGKAQVSMFEMTKLVSGHVK